MDLRLEAVPQVWSYIRELKYFLDNKASTSKSIHVYMIPLFLKAYPCVKSSALTAS